MQPPLKEKVVTTGPPAKFSIAVPLQEEPNRPVLKIHPHPLPAEVAKVVYSEAQAAELFVV